jgi:hypothetical protein
MKKVLRLMIGSGLLLLTACEVVIQDDLQPTNDPGSRWFYSDLHPTNRD